MEGFPSRAVFSIAFLRAALVAAICSSAGETLAQPSAAGAAARVDSTRHEDDRVSRAREAYSRGVTAYEQRRYKDAIDLFNQANRLTPNPAFSFNIGIAYEEMGDPALALSHYRAYVRLAPQAPDRNEVDQRVEKLELKLQEKGVQQVTILSEPPGATVSIDDAALGVTPWTGEVAPGHHRVSLQLRGYRDEVRDFDLPPARSIDVPVTMLVEEPPPATASRESVLPPAASVSTDSSFFAEIRPLSWAVLGAGAASLGAALVFELARSSAESDARNEPVQIKAAPLLDKANSRETYVVGFGIAGGALLVAGGALAAMDIYSSDEIVAAGNCRPDGCALSLSTFF